MPRQVRFKKSMTRGEVWRAIDLYIWLASAQSVTSRGNRVKHTGAGGHAGVFRDNIQLARVEQPAPLKASAGVRRHAGADGGQCAHFFRAEIG